MWEVEIKHPERKKSCYIFPIWKLCYSAQNKDKNFLFLQSSVKITQHRSSRSYPEYNLKAFPILLVMNIFFKILDILHTIPCRSFIFSLVMPSLTWIQSLVMLMRMMIVSFLECSLQSHIRRCSYFPFIRVYFFSYSLLIIKIFFTHQAARV